MVFGNYLNSPIPSGSGNFVGQFQNGYVDDYPLLNCIIDPSTCPPYITVTSDIKKPGTGGTPMNPVEMVTAPSYVQLPSIQNTNSAKVSLFTLVL